LEHVEAALISSAHVLDLDRSGDVAWNPALGLRLGRLRIRRRRQRGCGATSGVGGRDGDRGLLRESGGCGREGGGDEEESSGCHGRDPRLRGGSVVISS